MDDEKVLDAVVSLVNTHEMKLEYLKDKVLELEEMIEAIAVTHNNHVVAVSELAHALKEKVDGLAVPATLLSLERLTVEQNALPSMESLNAILERSKVEGPEDEEPRFDPEKLLNELCEAVNLEGKELDEFRAHFKMLFEASDGSLLKMADIVEAMNTEAPDFMPIVGPSAENKGRLN